MVTWFMYEDYLLYHQKVTMSFPVNMLVFRITESCYIKLEKGHEYDQGEV